MSIEIHQVDPADDGAIRDKVIATRRRGRKRLTR
jgi:hypothetical protein